MQFSISYQTDGNIKLAIKTVPGFAVRNFYTAIKLRDLAGIPIALISLAISLNDVSCIP